jgi:hypothetical protein
MRRLVPFALAALAASAIACGTESSDDNVGEGEGAFTSRTREVCDLPAQPQSLDDLKKLDSCELKSLFEDQANKVQTMGMPLPNGAYEGVPLCRKDIIVESEQLPPRIKEIHGARFITGLLKISNTLTNKFANQLWHGKEFTAADGAKEGTVLNFIDVKSEGINETTKKSAEAIHAFDEKNQWMFLDYTPAATGLDGLLEGVSVKLIQHVYDTARVVNAKEGIWLGMAWLVNEPGKYEPGTPNTVPSCYFALKRKQ